MLRVFFYIGFTCLFNVSILKSMCILIGWWQEGARNSIIWRALDVLMSVKWLLSFFCLCVSLGFTMIGVLHSRIIDMFAFMQAYWSFLLNMKVWNLLLASKCKVVNEKKPNVFILSSFNHVREKGCQLKEWYLIDPRNSYA